MTITADVDHPYETSRSAADLQQICLDENRSTADYFIVCRVCFQSATLRDVNTADAKQTNNRSTDYLQRLQMICNTLKPKKRYNIGETLTVHLLFDT